MLFQNVFFRDNGTFTDVKVAQAMGTNVPPYHDIHWLLNNVDGLLLRPREHNVHYFNKQSEGLSHQTTIHVSTLHQSISHDLFWILLL